MVDIMTYKSGKFTFSATFSKDEIQPLLIRAVILNETVTQLPVLPDIASQLDVDLIASSVAGTVAIEGNPLREADVKNMIRHKDVKAVSSRHKQEIANILEAYESLKKIKSSNTPFLLSEQYIKDVHITVTKDLDYEHNLPGGYRNRPVEVGDKSHGGVYRPPKVLDDIRMLMEAFVSWINSEEIIQLGPFTRAFLSHYYFSLIHPFGDGNGRTARLIESAILRASNIRFLPKMLSNYYYRNIDDYYCAFSNTEHNKHDLTPFLLFCFTGSVDSLTDMKDHITYLIRQFALRDYVYSLKVSKVITTRQFDLANFMLEADDWISIDEVAISLPYAALYRNVSKQTVKRDIQRLTENNLVVSDEHRKFRINITCLDEFSSEL